MEFSDRKNDRVFYDRTRDYALEIKGNRIDFSSRNIRGRVGYIKK